jgi:hypothetical protein
MTEPIVHTENNDPQGFSTSQIDACVANAIAGYKKKPNKIAKQTARKQFVWEGY